MSADDAETPASVQRIDDVRFVVVEEATADIALSDGGASARRRDRQDVRVTVRF